MGKLNVRSKLWLPALGLALILLIVRTFHRPLDSYTPEQINDMFQDKQASLVHVRKVELREQGLWRPYIDADTLRSPNWNLAGNYQIKEDLVRLVSDSQQQVANMFTKMPIQAQSFEMELTFHIQSKNTRNLYADGMAVWFLDEASPLGDVFGAKNYFTGLGIFVDTYRNGKQNLFPHIVAMVGDGRTEYSKMADGFDTMLASCRARKAVNPESGSVRMRIVYLKDGYLSLDLNYEPDNDKKWRNCFTVADVKLPVVKYLGFSAETGELSHSVDIIENKVFALYHPESNDFVASIKDFENMIETQQEVNDKTTTNKKRRTTRKSLRRLKSAERRIKEKERRLRQEKYGDPDATLMVRIGRMSLTIMKWAFVVFFLGVFSYIGYNVYRTRKQTRRSKATGLLD